MIYDRQANSLIDDDAFGARSTKFLYATIPGRLLLKIAASKWFSAAVAKYYRSRFSVKKIASIVSKYQIDLRNCTAKTFASFNDFFTRRLKPGTRPFSRKSADFIAPADAKLLAKPISEKLILRVKGGNYSVADMINDDVLAKTFAGGECLIFRLSLDDCHHYIFPDDGSVNWTKNIAGKLHTVQPIAHQKYKSYIRNQRIVSNLHTKHFGEIIMIEVGALLVGKINNRDVANFQKGDEKGYFELGGSTIIVLLKPRVLQIDADIARYSAKNIEVKVKMGETIGRLNA